MYAGRAEADEHPGPALGLFHVIPPLSFRGHTIFGENSYVRRRDDAVLHRFVANLQRRKEQFKLIRHEKIPPVEPVRPAAAKRTRGA